MGALAVVGPGLSPPLRPNSIPQLQPPPSTSSLYQFQSKIPHGTGGFEGPSSSPPSIRHPAPNPTPRHGFGPARPARLKSGLSGQEGRGSQGMPGVLYLGTSGDCQTLCDKGSGWGQPPTPPADPQDRTWKRGEKRRSLRPFLPQHTESLATSTQSPWPPSHLP